jgi:hypothetical protein
MTPEVAKRLGEITVDPKTVTLAKKVDMSSAPTVNASGKWNLTADAEGQQFAVTLDLKQDGANVNGTLSSDIANGTIQKRQN